MAISIISVDYQNDFCTEGGKFYKPRPCHLFIQDVFVPFLIDHNIKIGEILCDYRLPRPTELEEWCVPGTWGFLSAIDAKVKLPNVWIKGMHSPEWIRKDGGLPYQDPGAFNCWLQSTIGTPIQAGVVILLGLTLDVCVLCVAQQLSFRGYDVRILKEASDIYDLDDVAELTEAGIDYKEILFKTSHREFAKLISWSTVKLKLLSDPGVSATIA